jgi:hypothetical protein
MDVQFHKDHQKIMVNNDDNQVFQFLPINNSLEFFNFIYFFLNTFQAILFPLVSCSRAMGKSPRS